VRLTVARLLVAFQGTHIAYIVQTGRTSIVP
jgi:hypothetical protein